LIKATPSADEKSSLDHLASLRASYQDLFRETVAQIEFSGPQGARTHFVNKT